MMKKFIQKWNRLPKWVRNRYFITAFVFFIWMLFFDQHDLITQYQLKSELTELEKTREYYKTEIKKTRNDLEELLTNDEKLERFAREKYLMKKEDEDIFVIVEKDDQKLRE